MRYFVFAENGEKYGPADVDTLNHWIEEGRLRPEMFLEEEGSHHKVAAASVADLDFYMLEESTPDAEDAPPARHVDLDLPEPESTNNEILISFGMVVATLILAFVPGTAGFLGIMTTILGLISAIKAKERGNVTGGTAIIVNMVVLVIWIAARVIFQLKAS